MTFMESLLQQNYPIWDKCADTPFVQKLKNGTLPTAHFREYMIQDTIYLKHYARVFGKAIYHATALKDIQTYHSLLGFVTDAESAVRFHYLAQSGITQEDAEQTAPLPETQHYIDFLHKTAASEDNCAILMATLPCMLSYSYIFQAIAKAPESRQSPYWDFIADYADDLYAKQCKEWCAFAQQKCEPLSQSDLETMCRIFKQASLLELDFWNMPYRVCSPKSDTSLHKTKTF